MKTLYTTEYRLNQLLSEHFPQYQVSNHYTDERNPEIVITSGRDELRTSYLLKIFRTSLFVVIVPGAEKNYYQRLFESAKVIEEHELDSLGPDSLQAERRKPLLLKPKEKRFLAGMAEGLRAKEISAELQVSYTYVLRIKQNLMRKLGFRDEKELLRYAFLSSLSQRKEESEL